MEPFFNYLGAHIWLILQTIILLITAIVGIWQYMSSNKRNYSEFVLRLNDTYNNPKIKKVLYMFDYNENKWYNKEFHKSGELEDEVDSTLQFLDSVCYLKKNACIQENDFNTFKYNLHRTICNKGIQEYFFNLYHWSQNANGIKGTTILFPNLFTYAKENGFIGEEFYNKNSKKYPHYLNF